MKKDTSSEDFNKATRNFWMRTLKFTEFIVICVTALYVLNWFTSVVLILWAIAQTQNFAYLDTLITETSETFRSVVGVAIIKFGVENIFKYNDFGGRVPNKEDDTETVEEEQEEEKG